MKSWLSDPGIAFDSIRSGALFNPRFAGPHTRTNHDDASKHLHALDSNSSKRYLTANQVGKTLSQSTCPTADDLRIAMNACGAICMLTYPLHVLVENSNSHPRQELSIRHLHRTPLGPGSLVPLTKTVYVCSPELAFTQMASELARPNLVRLGNELCGGYTLAPGITRGFADCYPITSPDNLESAINSLAKMRGCKNARIALTRVRTGCASPAEADGLIVLCFPRIEGGLWTPYPLVNSWVETEKAHRLYGQAKGYFCDFYWPEAKLIVELDGREGHSDDKSRIQDASKKRALELSGYKVITIVNSQLRNRMAMDAIGNDILRTLGVAKHNVPKGYEASRRKLHAQLFG